MVKRKAKKKLKKNIYKDFWFRKRKNATEDGWGFIPINWKGWIALILLIILNVFAANYFNLNELVLDSWISFGVVFLLSIFVFVMIARRKTRGVKVGKK